MILLQHPKEATPAPVTATVVSTTPCSIKINTFPVVLLLIRRGKQGAFVPPGGVSLNLEMWNRFNPDYKINNGVSSKNMEVVWENEMDQTAALYK